MSLTQELKDTLVLILAGGQGERLMRLTSHRAKPAVPFGGAYRIIDFTLSNCIHSGLRRIMLLTQYQARSLEEHIRFGWNFLPRRLEQFIGVLPPHHLSTEEKWYRGTADAIYHNLGLIEDESPKHVMILSGDHIYKMDYAWMLRDHLIKRAKCTVGAVRIPASEAPRFGIVEHDARGRVTGFDEKPKSGAKEIPGDPGYCLGSMGIYIFETEELKRRLLENAERNEGHDFGRNIIPAMVDEEPVFAHNFRHKAGDVNPYWRDVGTIDSLYEANMDLCSLTPQFNLYDFDWPIYTLWHNDPPAKCVFDAKTRDSLLCPGVIVSGSQISRSILSNRVLVQEGALVEDSLLYHGVTVRPGAKLRRTIVDKWTEIPPGVEIGFDRARDEKHFTVTPSGITIIPSRYKFT
ncbi:MAG: glucose-1-phosphate adenylyltransferase [Planctomycetes bacterium]|nr:glucose-1-phosphate adenylyltransferase [Planctomycetota bacterium]